MFATNMNGHGNMADVLTQLASGLASNASVDASSIMQVLSALQGQTGAAPPSPPARPSVPTAPLNVSTADVDTLRAFVRTAGRSEAWPDMFFERIIPALATSHPRTLFVHTLFTDRATPAGVLQHHRRQTVGEQGLVVGAFCNIETAEQLAHFRRSHTLQYRLMLATHYFIVDASSGAHKVWTRPNGNSSAPQEAAAIVFATFPKP